MTAAAKHRGVESVRRGRKRQKARCRNRCHPSSKAIESVDEVDHVREPDQVDNGHRDRQQAEQDKSAPGRTSDVVDSQSRRDDEACCGDLPEELHPPREVEDVVREPDQEHEHHAGRDACQRDAAICPVDQRALPSEASFTKHLQTDGGRDTQEDRHSPKARYRIGVDLPAAGLIHKTVSQRDDAHEGSDDQRDHGGGGYEKRVVARAHELTS